VSFLGRGDKRRSLGAVSITVPKITDNMYTNIAPRIADSSYRFFGIGKAGVEV
jgi:hypothetical protein